MRYGTCTYLTKMRLTDRCWLIGRYSITRTRSRPVHERLANGINSQSGTGSRSTVYVPPLDEMSDIQSLSGTISLCRIWSLASAHHARATDDGAVLLQGYLYPGDPRVISRRVGAPRCGARAR